MNTQKNFFGWEKWLLMSIVIASLSAIIVFFNVRVFDWLDGAPYIGVVVFLVIVSFVITIHIKRGHATPTFLKTAFVFEVLLCLTLAASAVYSLSVMRAMSVAGQAEQEQVAKIEAIGKLKGSRVQREALKTFGDEQIETRQATFARNERVLFWLMVAEAAIGIIASLSLIGLAVFSGAASTPEDDQPKRIGLSPPSAPRRPLTRPAMARIGDDGEDEKPRFEVPKTPASFPEQKDAAKTHASFDSEGLKALRDVLKDISFGLPGRSFKAEVKPDHVYVRMMRANEGEQETAHSAKLKLSILGKALSMPRADFQARLERSLKRAGFEL